MAAAQVNSFSSRTSAAAAEAGRLRRRASALGTSTSSKRIDVCHSAHQATPSMDAGLTSALRDPTATFALSVRRPRALNFDKVCQTVNQLAQIAQQRISKPTLDSILICPFDKRTRTEWCGRAALRRRVDIARDAIVRDAHVRWDDLIVPAMQSATVSHDRSYDLAVKSAGQ